MFRFLTQPHPSFRPSRKGVYICLLAGLCVFFVLFFLRPLGTRGLAFWQRFGVSLLFGGITAVMAIFNTCLLPFLFPKLFDESRWTVWKEILFFTWMLLSIASVNLAVSVTMGDGSFSWSNLGGAIWGTAVIGVVPLTVSILLKQQLLLKRYASGARELNLRIEKEPPHDHGHSPVPLGIHGDNQDEQLSVLPENLLYIASSDNYIRICYLENGSPRQVLFRSTLKKAAGQLEKYPAFFRCHRMYIVNLQQVIRVSGNAQGYKLHLGGLAEPVPVSRSLNAEITGRLEHLP